MFTHSKSLLRTPSITHSSASAKVLWLSDLHLNVQDLWPAGHDAFLHQLSKQAFDHLVITGDISTSRYLQEALLSISEAAGHRSVYFVLGNHDFYGSSFDAVDNAVARICRARTNLHHLGSGEIIELTKDAALIGHRGWADGKAGYGRNTITRAKDGKWIDDFKGESTEAVFSRMQRLGEASGNYFQEMLPKALHRYGHVLVATHVPPFVLAAHSRTKRGIRVCRKTELPFFTNVSAGERLKQIILAQPGKRLTVLCGHTHRANTYNETPALRVHVAGGQWMESLKVA